MILMMFHEMMGTVWSGFTVFSISSRRFFIFYSSFLLHRETHDQPLHPRLDNDSQYEVVTASPFRGVAVPVPGAEQINRLRLSRSAFLERWPERVDVGEGGLTLTV